MPIPILEPTEPGIIRLTLAAVMLLGAVFAFGVWLVLTVQMWLDDRRRKA